MRKIQSVVNGNVVEESDDQAAFYVDAGLFVYLDEPDEPAAGETLAAVYDGAFSPEPAKPTVRRSRGRKG